jgi:hypothetical protein
MENSSKMLGGADKERGFFVRQDGEYSMAKMGN